MALHPRRKDSHRAALFAKEREAVVRGNSILLPQNGVRMLPGEKTQMVKCRMRSLGCVPCTGAIRSDADTVPKIIDEMVLLPPLGARKSRHRPRRRRLDGDQEARRIFLNADSGYRTNCRHRGSAGRLRNSPTRANNYLSRIRRRIRRRKFSHPPADCCASAPPAASTTANPP